MSHGGDRYRNKVKYDFSINVNPLGMQDEIIKSAAESIRDAVYYPDPENDVLSKKLSRTIGVPPERIIFGNGASELLMAVMHAVSPKKVLLPVPSFTGYEHVIKAVGSQKIIHQMRESDGFALREDFMDRLSDDIDLLFLTNPNNPTGAYIDHDLLVRILDLCKKKDIKVLLDECFMELSDDPEKNTCIGELDRWPNILVLRAFTKSFAMPGFRLGYLLCSEPKLAGRIRAQLPEWNISIPACAAGIAALDGYKELHKARELIKKERSCLRSELERLGFECMVSKANYILFRHRQLCDAGLYGMLLKKEILIRDCSDYEGLPAGFYRCAVRTHKENEIFIRCLEDTVKEII